MRWMDICADHRRSYFEVVSSGCRGERDISNIPHSEFFSTVFIQGLSIGLVRSDLLIASFLVV